MMPTPQMPPPMMNGAPPAPPQEPSVMVNGELDPQILKALEGPVTRFVQENIYNDVDPEKTIQYAQARRSHLYWEGHQYLFPEIQGGQIIDYQQIPQSAGMQNLLSQNFANRGLYDAVINVVWGDGNKFIAVLGNRAPNPKALPLRPDNEDHARRAKRADRIIQALRKLWPVDSIQSQLALFAWKDGTFFLHTPWEVDGERYGTSKVDIYEEGTIEPPPMFRCLQCGTVDEQGEICPQCGNAVMTQEPQEPMTVPIHKETKTYENGAPGIYPETIFTTRSRFIPAR